MLFTISLSTSFRKLKRTSGKTSCHHLRMRTCTLLRKYSREASRASRWMQNWIHRPIKQSSPHFKIRRRRTKTKKQRMQTSNRLPPAWTNTAAPTLFWGLKKTMRHFLTYWDSLRHSRAWRTCSLTSFISSRAKFSTSCRQSRPSMLSLNTSCSTRWRASSTTGSSKWTSKSPRCSAFSWA